MWDFKNFALQMYYEEENQLNTFIRSQGYTQCVMGSNTNCTWTWVCLKETPQGTFKPQDIFNFPILHQREHHHTLGHQVNAVGTMNVAQLCHYILCQNHQSACATSQPRQCKTNDQFKWQRNSHKPSSIRFNIGFTFPLFGAPQMPMLYV